MQGRAVSPVCPSLLKDSLVVDLASPSFLLHLRPVPGWGSVLQAKAQLFATLGKFPCPWNFPSWLWQESCLVKCHQGWETHLPPRHCVGSPQAGSQQWGQRPQEGPGPGPSAFACVLAARSRPEGLPVQQKRLMRPVGEEGGRPRTPAAGGASCVGRLHVAR